MSSIPPKSLVQFLDDCYSCHGIAALLRTANKYFENACLLMDASYKTLYYVGGEDINDRTWEESVNGHFSSETLDEFVSENLLNKELDVISPCFTPRLYENGHAKNLRRASVAIPFQDGSPCAWFTIFENNRAFTEEDMELLSWFARILAPYLELLSSKKVQPYGRVQNLLVDLLNNNFADTQMAEDNLLIFGWRLKRFNRILLIESENGTISQPMREYITRILRQQFPQVADFIYNNLLVCVISSDENAFRNDYLDELRAVFKRFNLFAGFSSTFNSIADIRNHYLKISKCLRIIDSTLCHDSIFFFEDYSVDAMLIEASRFLSLKEYVHPVITALKEYDATHKTEYVISLKEFVLNMRNLNAAAQQMHIHRNTLSYRIDRILDLLGIDSIDNKLLADLYISYKILGVDESIQKG